MFNLEPMYQQVYIFIQYKLESLGRPRRWCCWSNYFRRII